VTVTGSGTGSLMLAGTQSAINAFIAASNVAYTTALNANGSVTLTVTSNDLGNAGSGGAKTDVDTVTLNISAVNDPPVNTVPGAQSTAEDTSKAITGLSINDVDAGSSSMTVTLGVTNGTLTVSGGSATIANSGTSTVTLTGTMAQINATLAANVTYVPTVNFNGTATLTMTTNDGGNTGSGGPMTDVDTVSINVTAVNDAPVNTVPASITVTEDTASPITGISVNDVDAGSSTINVTLGVPAGTLAAASGSGVTVTGSGTGSLMLAGTQSAINAFIAASNVAYTTALNTNGSVTLTVTSNDLGNAGSGGALTDVDTVALNITAVNDAPVNTVPAAQSTNEDTSKAITGLSISDVDAGSGAMSVTLGITHGTLTVSGGSAAIANSGTSSVTLTGTMAQINATLAANVTYVPTANYGGAATLTMTTNDGGNTGSGGALTDVDTVAINVVAVADTPMLLTLPSQINAIVAGVNTISASTGITAANLAGTIGLPAATLNSFDPAAGSTTSDPGNVTAFNGAVSNFNYEVMAGTNVAFKWTFTNAEDTISEINQGYNDMVVVTVTAPDGTQTSQLITASETLGPLNNGAGTYTFAAPTDGHYQFSWMVINGLDGNKSSSVAINDVSLNIGGKAYGAIVDVPIQAALTDTDGSETLSVSVSGVPAGSGFSAGTDHGGGLWTFASTELSNLKYLAADGFTGTVNLTVSATSTESSNGSTVTTASQSMAIVVSETTNTIAGTVNGETLTGTAAGDHIQGLAGNDTINAGTGNDLVHGGLGNDAINGQDGNDILYGDAGTDTLNGGNGNDILVGGAGNDNLTGGAGADVFRWELGDAGTPGTPVADTVADFDNSAAGDKLDLRDLLQGETLGTLTNYLHFAVAGGNTVVSISTTGAFSSGFASASVDQTITLTGVNLVGAFTTDQQIVQDLLQRGKLLTDPGG
jgi:Ca2+-binding RTX toxin-like protein